jgi:hypothetical protein
MFNLNAGGPDIAFPQANRTRSAQSGDIARERASLNRGFCALQSLGLHTLVSAGA